MKTIITEIPGLYSFYRGFRVLETGYPWLTLGAIMALEKILRDSKGQFNILEFGSGGSTVFFQDKCKSLLSFEDKKNWYLKVKSRITNPRVTIRYRKFMTLLYMTAQLPDNYYDIVLLDAFSGGNTYQKRGILFPKIVCKVKKGGWLIVDNYDAFDSSMYAEEDWDIYTFDMFHYSGKGTRFYRKL